MSFEIRGFVSQSWRPVIRLILAVTVLRRNCIGLFYVEALRPGPMR